MEYGELESAIGLNSIFSRFKVSVLLKIGVFPDSAVGYIESNSCYSLVFIKLHM